MVITKLYGGLGNQMFQYAVGRVLSLKLKANLYLDLDWFEHIKGNGTVTQRIYELDVFGIQPKKLSLKDRLSIKRNPPKVFQEHGLGYQSEFNGLRGNVILDGYWQSYKYVASCRDQIIKDFAFPIEISNENKHILQMIKNTNSISLHIRRGDYANVKHTNEYHGLVPTQYYKDAVAQISKKVPNVTYFIFSDDPGWCQKNLKLNVETIYVTANKGPKSGVEDMRLMAACQHNIIANSSFSWWAAWLNQSPDKIVVAPNKWFQKEDAALNDRLPKNWIRL